MSYADGQYMVFRCGTRMHTLKHEIEKLTAYSREAVVTKADIDAVTVPVLEARVFGMCAELAAKRTGKAVSILRDLIALKEEPVEILGALSWQLRGMYAARIVIDRKQDVKSYMELTNARSRYQAQEMMNAAKKHTTHWCRNAVRLCLETDRALKGLSRNRDRELELLLARLS